MEKIFDRELRHWQLLPIPISGRIYAVRLMHCMELMEGALRKKVSGLHSSLSLSGAFLFSYADKGDHASGFSLIASMGKKQFAVAN